MKILVASDLCPRALKHLEEHHDLRLAIGAPESELRTAIADRDVLVFRSGVDITRTVLSSAPSLRLLIRAGSGLDNLDVAYARERQMVLFRIPEPGAQAVAELAFAFMLHLAREIRWNDQEIRRGQWTKASTTGYILRGKVLGIVGAGNIGSRVGEMGAAWGMKPIGCVESPTRAVRDQLASKGIRLAELEEVAREADFLTIHVPKQPSTLNLIGSEVLSWMKPTAFLINLARGGVVDEAALLDGLEGPGAPAGAALDVHATEGQGCISPLASLSNVVLTPHIGATTVDTQREIGERVIEVVEAFQRTPGSFSQMVEPGTSELSHGANPTLSSPPAAGP